MVGIPLLESGFCEANVLLTSTGPVACYYCFINDAFCLAHSFKRALMLCSTVALSGGFRALVQLPVVCADDAGQVWHTTVADFQCVFAEDLV